MKESNSQQRSAVSAIDEALGSVLSWVAGKDSVKRGRGPTDGALGELLSWVIGPSKRRR